MMRHAYFWTVAILALLMLSLMWFWPPILYLAIFWVPYTLIGIYDMLSSHNVLRNYPVIGHLRYLFEFIRPEIQQYFVATNQSGEPYSRELRTLVYERAKGADATLPFGTQRNITESGYEFAYHSLAPKTPLVEKQRVLVGSGPRAYLASCLNISGMSFGALSSTAVEAMNKGAKLGNFMQTTGEGGLTEYHLKHGGDICWQIGTGYFGCRSATGDFDAAQFQEKAQADAVKMIEIKLSQGAKPSHGGILPGAKVNAEIARIREVSIGEDCISPPAHTAFATPLGLLDFIEQLRELTGGKPVGFKLCIGIKREFMAICKAMLAQNVYPDFITVDGAEGGTGAAPLEFSNRLGTPINEALSFVHNCLVGCGIRDKIRLVASGKVTTGFDMMTKMALGANMCNIARAMMFSVGCIQALRCDTNTCPTGVTTQDPKRIKALVPKEKAIHVMRYHQATIESCFDIIGAMGLTDPAELAPHHILRRMPDSTAKNYAELYPLLQPGELLAESIPPAYAKVWQQASAEQF